MKISASKKQLAKIISENGGWRDGEWAAQEACGFIYFYNDKPTRSGAFWHGTQLHHQAIQGSTVPNWHQIILSRDEYFHLYPAQDADGWIEWKGGERPVDGQTMIDVKFRYGACATSGADCFNFTHDDHKASDIIAYRLHKPEQSKSTAVGDDETNMAAKEELEALESGESPEQRAKLAKIYAPSIEQLAADYRAKLAIAQQAQEEADSRRAEAEAALDRLYQAGLEIGLDIAIASDDSELEHELVITDWRDLLVGDEIMCVGRSWPGHFEGLTCEVIDVEREDYHGDAAIRVQSYSGGKSWGLDFRFIRRP